MPTIKVSLNIGISNASQEDELDIDEDEWDACETDEDRDELVNEYWKDWMWNYIDGYSELVEDT
jgi:hypothetical protein